MYRLLSVCPRTSPVMRTQYNKLGLLAKVAQVLGATQVLLQAI